MARPLQGTIQETIPQSRRKGSSIHSTVSWSGSSSIDSSKAAVLSAVSDALMIVIKVPGILLWTITITLFAGYISFHLTSDTFRPPKFLSEPAANRASNQKLSSSALLHLRQDFFAHTQEQLSQELLRCYGYPWSFPAGKNEIAGVHAQLGAVSRHFREVIDSVEINAHWPCARDPSVVANHGQQMSAVKNATSEVQEQIRRVESARDLVSEAGYAAGLLEGSFTRTPYGKMCYVFRSIHDCGIRHFEDTLTVLSEIEELLHWSLKWYGSLQGSLELSTSPDIEFLKREEDKVEKEKELQRTQEEFAEQIEAWQRYLSKMLRDFGYWLVDPYSWLWR